MPETIAAASNVDASIPANCPLSPEQFARLHPDFRSSQTVTWIPDASNMCDELLDRLVSECNPKAIKAFAHFLVHQHVRQHTATSESVRNGVANGR